MKLKSKIWPLYLILLFALNVNANHWTVANLPYYNGEVSKLYVDSNYLYACGYIYTTPGSGNSTRICRYDGSQWISYGAFDGKIFSVIVYNGILYACGSFIGINGIPISNIAFFDGTNWQPFGNFNQAIVDFKIFNGELYVVGYFNQVDSVPINGIAKWNGTNWIDVHNFPYSANLIIHDAEMYNNNLYVAGSISDGANHLYDIAVYKDSMWQAVDQGIQGTFSGVEKLAVYKNELYAGGLIRKVEGNVGNCIQKWNDTTWTEVGTGLQDFNNSYNGFAQIHDMLVYNNELYVSGTFYYAGNVPAQALAKWDGARWCGLGTSTDLPDFLSSKINCYKDTLFMGTGYDTLDGVFANGLIKWVGGNYIDTCSVLLSVDETDNLLQINLYPNPSKDLLQIQSGNVRIDKIKIIAALGKEIYSEKNLSRNYQLDISFLKSGIYFLVLDTKEGRVVKKFVKE